MIKAKTFTGESFVDSVVIGLQSQLNILEEENKLTFYEAVGYLVSAEQDFEKKQLSINTILDSNWKNWDLINNDIEQNPQLVRVKLFTIFKCSRTKNI